MCASAEWAALVRDELLPWVLGDDGLGDDVLEIGAGPGLVTDLLVERRPTLPPSRSRALAATQEHRRHEGAHRSVRDVLDPGRRPDGAPGPSPALSAPVADRERSTQVQVCHAK